MQAIVFEVSDIDLLDIFEALLRSFGPSKACPCGQNGFEFDDLALTADFGCTIAIETSVEAFEVHGFVHHDIEVAVDVPRFRPFHDFRLIHRSAQYLVLGGDLFTVEEWTFAVLQSNLSFEDTRSDVGFVQYRSHDGRQIVVVAVWYDLFAHDDGGIAFP